MINRARTVLVFGAGGQIARELMQRPTPHGFAIVGLNKEQADITDRETVDRTVQQHQPAVIINAAAYTAVDKAEAEPDRAIAANETGSHHVASAAREAGAILIQLSTDYVFDGRKADAYLEQDPVSPISVYGRSKEAGERAVRDTTPRHIILRTAWVYAAHSNNFLTAMLRLARERDVVRVVADQHGAPTLAADLADALFALLPQLQHADTSFGTFHLTNSGQTTWYEFAKTIFTAIGQHGGRVPHLEAITTAEYPTPAQRPAKSVLDCGKIARVYGIRLRPWEVAARKALRTLLTHEVERGEI
jgi:dTDP-4-dehydrorhamnose reductase